MILNDRFVPGLQPWNALPEALASAGSSSLIARKAGALRSEAGASERFISTNREPRGLHLAARHCCHRLTRTHIFFFQTGIGIGYFPSWCLE